MRIPQGPHIGVGAAGIVDQVARRDQTARRPLIHTVECDDGATTTCYGWTEQESYDNAQSDHDRNSYLAPRGRAHPDTVGHHSNRPRPASRPRRLPTRLGPDVVIGLVAALRDTGLTVWWDHDRIDTFDGITGRLEEGIAGPGWW
jgi:hypothetical protein